MSDTLVEEKRVDRVIAYLEAIEEINRAEQQLTAFQDRRSVARLESALDIAAALWLLIPPELQVQLSPPPERQDYLSEFALGGWQRFSRVTL